MPYKEVPFYHAKKQNKTEEPTLPECSQYGKKEALSRDEKGGKSKKTKSTPLSATL